MNFYKHHIGDYAKKTAHLSLLEHGAYLLLLHAYYGSEKPLPTGEALYRIARAHTKAERAAVDVVAAQFWNPTSHGLVNGRAFEELEIATGLVETARQNGNKGGRPKTTQRVIENKPSGLPEENPVGLLSEPSGKAIQTPDSNIPERGENGLDGRASKLEQKPRPAKRVPADFIPDASFALTEISDLDVEAEVAKLRDWEFKTARSDWPAVWRTWIRNAKQTGRYARKTAVKWQ